MIPAEMVEGPARIVAWDQLHAQAVEALRKTTGFFVCTFDEEENITVICGVAVEDPESVVRLLSAAQNEASRTFRLAIDAIEGEEE
jgi:hypothetical protein